MTDETREFQDDMLSATDMARVARLSVAEVAAIDHALLQCMTQRWQKVAMVVAKAMQLSSDQFPDVPDFYFSLRVRELVARKALESQGNLLRMRYSEVRIRNESNA